ncbi:hypothetical protein ACTZWW_11120 [Salinarimonas sp. NSM]|uniref:hypothetical protein n=1 Tax=Salinarimonas sp. NSM TaxID=3458003 RepID=UPI0040351D71
MTVAALGSAFARGLGLALGTAAIVALRIVERDEALSPRTTLVIALFGAAGLLAGVAATLLLRRLAPAGAIRRSALAALAGLVLVPGVAFVLFAIDRNAMDVVWSFREDGLLSTLRHAVIGLTIDAAGAFAVTARPYLLPWPLAAIAACAMLTTVAPARRPVALAATLVAACLLVGAADRPVLAQGDMHSGDGFSGEHWSGGSWDGEPGGDAGPGDGAPVDAWSGDAWSGDAWTREKCARYTAAWDEATRRLGTDGISAEFIARHDAFIASGCTAPADVCPRSAEELALANVMVILAMNAGTASTFPPFACRD